MSPFPALASLNYCHMPEEMSIDIQPVSQPSAISAIVLSAATARNVGRGRQDPFLEKNVYRAICLTGSRTELSAIMAKQTKNIERKEKNTDRCHFAAVMAFVCIFYPHVAA